MFPCNRLTNSGSPPVFDNSGNDGDIDMRLDQDAVGPAPKRQRQSDTPSRPSKRTADDAELPPDGIELFEEMPVSNYCPYDRVIEDLTLTLDALGETWTGSDIAEVFCPGRFCNKASAFNLRPGTCLDLRTGWDADKPGAFKKLMDMIDAEKPELIIGSPKCAPFSTLIRDWTKDYPRYRAELASGLRHLKMVCAAYLKQIQAGRLFLHEHPRNASSWKIPCIKQILELPGIMLVFGDQCPFGLTGQLDDGTVALLRKETGWMTNGRHIAEAVSVRCTNRHKPCHMHHVHAPIRARRHNCRASERYPERLVLAVLRALRKELNEKYHLSPLDSGPHLDEPEPWDIHKEYYNHIYDGITGTKLPPDLVASTTADEMDFMKRLTVYEYDLVDNCLACTGKPPISVGWVRINKGDDDNPSIRCRLVVQETARQTSLDLSDPAQTFSATPPYEALRFLCSCHMTPKKPSDIEERVIAFIDVSRAHPHAPITRDVWIKLPAEDPKSKDPRICGKLKRSLYGTRDAGRNFELFTCDFMTGESFTQGIWSPCFP